MKKLMIAVLAAIVQCPAEVSAQGFLRKLGEKAAEAGKRKLEQKVEEKVEREVGNKADEILDGKSTSTSRQNNGDDAEVAQDDTPDAVAQKSDFVRGSVILF